MATGDRTAKKLSQGALTSSLVAQVTGAASTITQVTGMFFVNTGGTARTVTVTAFGTATANTLIQSLSLGAYATVVFNDPIVLAAGTILYAKQDTGTDVVLTTFGVEEQV